MSHDHHRNDGAIVIAELLVAEYARMAVLMSTDTAECANQTVWEAAQ